MLIVFLGPDGSGKTTVINSVIEKLRILYKQKEIKKYYWRPNLLKAPGVLLGLREENLTGVNPDPYGHKKENFLKSILRFYYYLTDYMLGGLYFSFNKDNIIIFDRYYCDILADKFRYNFTVPDILIKIGMFFVKEPDLIVYLDNSVETLLSRKKEIPEKDLINNIEKYKSILKYKKNTFVVNNERKLDVVVYEIVSKIREIC